MLVSESCRTTRLTKTLQETFEQQGDGAEIKFVHRKYFNEGKGWDIIKNHPCKDQQELSEVRNKLSYDTRECKNGGDSNASKLYKVTYTCIRSQQSVYYSSPFPDDY